MIRRVLLLIVPLVICSLAIISLAQADKSFQGCDSLLKTQLSAQILEERIASQITQVAEFRELRRICKRLGVRCWLFGGTAAGFAHYVKWDLQQQQGDLRFQPDRFDYDYTNIFRSTQDADLVIDGNEKQAATIEEKLRNKFPHLIGSKSIWEVRLLTEDRGEKEALLHNPDFLNQHTDSNSTGMIEVTIPPQTESVVRDLRDWAAASDGRHPIFLDDVFGAKLHYYYSENHHLTSRASRGLNPPILSVIRYLTKAFQYELQITGEDRLRIHAIVQEFDSRDVKSNSYVAGWIEKNGKKLIQHAVNIEYAWNVLEDLGLRRKLMRIGTQDKEGSLAWWMNKEPLRIDPVGSGSGETARELGIEVVAHETRDFLAYESITRAHTGDPNVLISRRDITGENAAYVDGFYTAIGKKGAAGTGFTIRFTVNPDARNGTDFKLVGAKANEGAFVVILNKAALRVIPQSLQMTPIDYFRMLAENRSFDESDRGIYERLKRSVGGKITTLSPQAAQEIFDLIRQSLKPESNLVLKEFFEHPALKRIKGYEELADEIIQHWINQAHKGTPDERAQAAKSLLDVRVVSFPALEVLVDTLEDRFTYMEPGYIFYERLKRPGFFLHERRSTGKSPNENPDYHKEAILRHLVNLLNLPNSGAVANLGFTLCTHAKHHRFVAQALVKILSHASAKVRSEVTRGLILAKLPDDELMDEAVARLLASEEKVTRQLLELMESSPSMKPERMEVFYEALNAPTYDVQEGAILMLSRKKDLIDLRGLRLIADRIAYGKNYENYEHSGRLDRFMDELARPDEYIAQRLEEYVERSRRELGKNETEYYRKIIKKYRKASQEPHK